eukprot:87597_1
MFANIRHEKRHISNGLYQNMYLLLRKMYAAANYDIKKAENIIRNYYDGDKTVKNHILKLPLPLPHLEQSCFTYNKHILLEMRSLFARMTLCNENKIIKCTKCVHCNQKHQFLIDSNHSNKNLELFDKKTFCDKLIETMRPMDVNLKDMHGTPANINEMIGCVTLWIVEQFNDKTLFEIKECLKIFCFDCKKFVSGYSYSNYILQTGGYKYYKHYKIVDYLSDIEEYLLKNNQYKCAKCNKKCDTKKKKAILKFVPKIQNQRCQK